MSRFEKNTSRAAGCVGLGGYAAPAAAGALAGGGGGCSSIRSLNEESGMGESVGLGLSLTQKQ